MTKVSQQKSKKLNRNFYADGRTFICVTCGAEALQRRNSKKNLYCSQPCQAIGQRGRPKSDEARKNMSLGSKGKRKNPATEFKKGQRPSPTTEFKTGHTPWHKGRTGVYTDDQLRRMTEAIRRTTYRGERHYNWKGGITNKNRYERSKFVKYTVPKVFARDNYTCQMCCASGVYLHADHIKSWSGHPELRFDVNNCRTLCVPCHYFVTFGREMPADSRWGFNTPVGAFDK